MSLSPDITTITVQGTYVDLNGDPISGAVRFTPNSIVIDTDQNQILVKRGVTVTLNASGFFSTTLPATNDPDYTPQPIAYQVEELFSGGRTFYLVLPISSAGVTQDIADLGEAGSSTDAQNYITTDEYNALLARYTTANGVVVAIGTAEEDTIDAESYATEAASALDTLQSNVGVSPMLLMGV
jgi:hypothetical protein